MIDTENLPERRPPRKAGPERIGRILKRVLPAGIDVDGTILTYEPHRECECFHCVRAFARADAGELEFPESGSLPW